MAIEDLPVPLTFEELEAWAGTGRVWRAAPAGPPPSQAGELIVRSVIRPGEAFTSPGLDPHKLYREDRSSRSRQGPGWGLYTGTMGLVLLTAGLTVSAHRQPPTTPA